MNGDIWDAFNKMMERAGFVFDEAAHDQQPTLTAEEFSRAMHVTASADPVADTLREMVEQQS